ncbi:hypothetical protein KI387_014884, partial [Taxus chinensis]
TLTVSRRQQRSVQLTTVPEIEECRPSEQKAYVAIGKDLSCNCFSNIMYRKTKMQAPENVPRHAIESCQLSIVCKEKL